MQTTSQFWYVRGSAPFRLTHTCFTFDLWDFRTLWALALSPVSSLNLIRFTFYKDKALPGSILPNNASMSQNDFSSSLVMMIRYPAMKFMPWNKQQQTHRMCPWTRHCPQITSRVCGNTRRMEVNTGQATYVENPSHVFKQHGERASPVLQVNRWYVWCHVSSVMLFSSPDSNPRPCYGVRRPAARCTELSAGSAPLGSWTGCCQERSGACLPRSRGCTVMLCKLNEWALFKEPY